MRSNGIVMMQTQIKNVKANLKSRNYLNYRRGQIAQWIVAVFN